MIIKIFKENPLSFGLYKSLPLELENEQGIVYEPTQEEINLINSGKSLKYEKGRIVLDVLEEQKILKLKEKHKVIKQKRIEIDKLEEWFKSYDESVVQFNRKTALHSQKIISDQEYQVEVDKINKLHLEAENKAKELKALKLQISQIL